MVYSFPKAALIASNVSRTQSIRTGICAGPGRSCERPLCPPRNRARTSTCSRLRSRIIIVISERGLLIQHLHHRFYMLAEQAIASENLLTIAIASLVLVLTKCRNRGEKVVDINRKKMTQCFNCQDAWFLQRASSK